MCLRKSSERTDKIIINANNRNDNSSVRISFSDFGNINKEEPNKHKNEENIKLHMTHFQSDINKLNQNDAFFKTDSNFMNNLKFDREVLKFKSQESYRNFTTNISNVESRNSINKTEKIKSKTESIINSPFLSEKITLNNISESNQVNDINRYRRKKTKVEFDPYWFLKSGLPGLNLTHKEILNYDYQKSTIIDSIKVILERVNFYKNSFLNKSEIKDVFTRLEINKQTKINITLEEICLLIFEISTDILANFRKYFPKITNKMPDRPLILTQQIVKCEEKELYVNASVFNEASNFLKNSFDAYLALTDKVRNLIIPHKNFISIHQYLSRIRLNISNLICSSKNYFKNYQFDIDIIEKYKNFIYKNENDNNNNLNKNDRLDHLNDRYLKLNTDNEYKYDEFTITKRRLRSIFSRKSDDLSTKYGQNKENISKSSSFKANGLNNPIIKKMYKYFPKDIRDLIMCEKLLDRNKERNSG